MTDPRLAAAVTHAALMELGWEIELHPTNPLLFRTIGIAPPCPVLYRARCLGRQVGRLEDPFPNYEAWHEIQVTDGWCVCPVEAEV